MNYVFGAITIFIGLFFIINAFMICEFVVYRFFNSKSKLLWKGNFHKVFRVVGIILVLVGFLFIFEVF